MPNSSARMIGIIPDLISKLITCATLSYLITSFIGNDSFHWILTLHILHINYYILDAPTSDLKWWSLKTVTRKGEKLVKNTVILLQFLIESFPIFNEEFIVFSDWQNSLENSKLNKKHNQNSNLYQVWNPKLPIFLEALRMTILP